MPDYSYTSGKLHRSHLLHYIDTSFGGQSPSWYLLGEDVEDASVELNPDIEVKKNILDETKTQDNGYEPSLDLDTFYAKPGDALYAKAKDIAMNRKTGDDCKTKVMEVLVDKITGDYDAWVEDIVFKPQSYGGPQGGVNIPFKIQFDGNRKTGTVAFNSTTYAPTFTEASEATNDTDDTDNTDDT